jgi:serine protease Do
MLTAAAALLAQSLAAPPSSGAGASLARQFSSDLADMVERVMPSVVVVRTEAVRYRRAYDLFYGRMLAIPEHLAGQGSGCVIDKDGHILTSAHVVSGAQQIQVVFPDAEACAARVVGVDRSTDLAVLEIEKPAGRELRPIELGDSDALRVAEMVVAIGSPFSLQSSVTMGIVSQKGRSVGVLPYEDFIQTDAPINPGNSGGPLVDLDGRLVGVNAVIQTAGPYAQGSIGIGFAVPVNLARRVAESIIRTGSFQPPWIGIGYDAGDPGAPASGVRVTRVYRGSPAERGGLRPGDVIAEVHGQPVRSLRDLQRAIIDGELGKAIPLRVRRGRETIAIAVPVERMPDLDERE